MKDFDLRDLDAFVAGARTRNFRRAATEQGVSVSSLSQRLRDMEERLGVRLMNRTTRSVALTEAGELLLARVGPAMSDVGAALDQVRGLRAVPSGRLWVGTSPMRPATSRYRCTSGTSTGRPGARTSTSTAGRVPSREPSFMSGISPITPCRSSVVGGAQTRRLASA